jgi:hypothetical protein
VRCSLRLRVAAAFLAAALRSALVCATATSRWCPCFVAVPRGGAAKPYPPRRSRQKPADARMASAGRLCGSAARRRWHRRCSTP